MMVDKSEEFDMILGIVVVIDFCPRLLALRDISKSEAAASLAQSKDR